jgi:hypothetical protein
MGCWINFIYIFQHLFYFQMMEISKKVWLSVCVCVFCVFCRGQGRCNPISKVLKISTHKLLSKNSSEKLFQEVHKLSPNSSHGSLFRVVCRPSFQPLQTMPIPSFQLAPSPRASANVGSRLVPRGWMFFLVSTQAGLGGPGFPDGLAEHPVVSC